MLGVGLNGLGYGAIIRPGELSIEWLRTNASLCALPISAAAKERIVNAERGSPHRWCKLNDGWHIGRWKYTCEVEDDDDVDQSSAQEAGEDEKQQRETGKEEQREEAVGEAQKEAEEAAAASKEAVVAADGDDGQDERELIDGEADAELGEGECDGASLSLVQLQRRSGEWQRVGADVSGERGGGGGGRSAGGGRRLHNSSRSSCRSCRMEMSGYGYFVNLEGVQFVGRFIRGVLNDLSGVIIDRIGVYHGEVVKAADTGRGTFYFRENGDVITGMWEEGRVKYGSIMYGDGQSLYTGAFNLNKPEGLGVVDYFQATPAPQYAETYMGCLKACHWKGCGLLSCSDRTIHAEWKGDGVQEESVTKMEGEDEEMKQRFRYGGHMRGTLPEGDGWMVWEDLTDQQRTAHRQDRKQRKELGARRRLEHQQRVGGDWSSLPRIVEYRATLSTVVAEVEVNLRSLSPRQPIPSNPRELVGAEASLYVGQFVRGKMHGQGTREWRNGDVYDGAWQMGICNGYGRWKSKDRGDVLGDVLYAGGWKNDKEHGLGTLINSMPTLGRMVFYGRFYEGWLTGMGSVYFFDSQRLHYIGRMVRGAFDGEGLMQLEDGSLYLGSFVDGEFKGNGRWLDARESSVYTGRFKNDHRHGCGRLVLHKHITAHPSITLTSSGADSSSSVPVDAEQGPADASHESSKELLSVAEQAFSRCIHRINLPRSFGAASHQYQAVFDDDQPVCRVLGRELDDLLDDIGYVEDAEDDGVDALIREEQLDCARAKKKAKKRQPQPSASSSSTLPSGKEESASPLSNGGADGGKEQLLLEREEKEREVQPLEDEDDGMRLLHHYQTELNRLSARSKRRGKREAALTSSISFPGSIHLEHSLRQPRTALSVFESVRGRSSSLRRIHLGKAVRLCVASGLCSFAVTGHLGADPDVMHCRTCSSSRMSERGLVEARRVEVCAACRAAGCHRGHDLRPMELMERMEWMLRTSGSSASQPKEDTAELFYCDCGTRGGGTCKTPLDDWREEIREAARPSEPEQPLDDDFSASPERETTPPERKEGDEASEHATAPSSPAAERLTHRRGRHYSLPDFTEQKRLFEDNYDALTSTAPLLAPLPNPMPGAEAPTGLLGEAMADTAQWAHLSAAPTSPSSLPLALASSAVIPAATAVDPHRRMPPMLPALKPRSFFPTSSLFKAPNKSSAKRWVKIDGKWKEIGEAPTDVCIAARFTVHVAHEAQSEGEERKEQTEVAEERKEGIVESAADDQQLKSG